MDAELIIYLWSIVCGAGGGIGRFCRLYPTYKKHEVYTKFIIALCNAVIGAVCAMIAVGWYFDKSLIENRLRAFAVAAFVGYIPLSIPVLLQMFSSLTGKSNGKNQGPPSNEV